MSSIEERRAGMIGSVTSGYRGTLASAERYRSRILQELPDIPYFTLQEQQEFIKTNGGQWDGQSFCGSNPIYPDGNCTFNALEQIQNSYENQNIPLLIPKKENNQKLDSVANTLKEALLTPQTWAGLSNKNMH